MFEFFSKLFDTSGFPDRWHCGTWTAGHGWLHIASDIATFGAYTTIPFVLIYFLRKRPDVPFPRIFFMFAAFIFACGTVHLIEATIFWWPVYRLSGVFKFITAVVSWGTVIMIVASAPRALRMRSTEELEREIQQRKKAEWDLRQSEQRFHAFMDNSPFIAWMKDAQGRHDFLSQPYIEQIGLSGDWQGKTDIELWSKDTAESHLASDEKVLRAGKAIAFESNEPLPDGTIKDWYVIKFPFTDPIGQLCVGGIAVDITEKVLVEKALQREHDLAESMIETAQNVILVLDTTGKIVRFNPYFASLTGWHFDELEGLDWIESLIPKEERAAIRKRFDLAILGHRTVGKVNGILCRDGSRREVEWYDAILLDNEKNQLGLLCTGQDITERKTLERHLLHIADEEQRRIGRDLHDGLGQELTGLAMMAQSLSMDLQNRSIPESKIAEMIAKQVECSLQQVRKLARGMNPVDIQPQGLESALSQLADHVTELYGIKCPFVCEGRVEVSDSETATNLYRIAQEAITNAAKHGKANEIEVELSHRAGFLRLQVKDNGIGIANSEKIQTGTGVQSMRYRTDIIGGTIRIEPGQQGGTVVTCALPME